MTKQIFFIAFSFLSFFAQTKNIEAITEVFPPFQFYDQNNQLTGISIDVLKELQLYGLNENTITVYPWARAYDLAAMKNNVLIFTMSKTQSRVSTFKWVYTYQLNNSPYFWFRNDLQTNNEFDWSDALKLTTAIPRSDTQFDSLLKQGFSERKNLYVTKDFESSIKMLIAGKVDFIYAGHITMLSQLNHLGISAKKFNTIKASNVEEPLLGFAFNIRTPEPIVNEFTNAFQELEKTGKIQKIIEKYLNKPAL